MSTINYLENRPPLHWVKDEISKDIKNIRNAIKTYGDALDDYAPLLPIVTRLHSVNGTLQILELYGGAMLAEEMEETIKYILGNHILSGEEAYEALVQAVLALESYFERLLAGEADLPIILLPLLNDLRASREDSLLTENALFSPDLSIVPKTPSEPPASDKTENHAAKSAEALRPYYQAALLSWYKNPRDQRSLQQMHAVVRNLEACSYQPRLRQLWWIIDGLLEALKDQGLASNVSVRLLLGQADRQMRILTKNQSDYLEKQPPIELLKNILFYIAHASSDGEKVKLLKSVYDLDSITPNEKDLANIRLNLTGPKSKAIVSIASEVEKTLEQIKSTIDSFMRDDNFPFATLAECIVPLRQIADTLSLINLGKERHLLYRQLDKLKTIVSQQTRLDNDTMMAIASAIVHVETLLHTIIESGQITPIQFSSNAMESNRRQSGMNHLGESEYRQLIKAAIEESKNNVGQVKNNILGFLTSNLKPKLLSKTPQLLNEIKGCFTLLSLQHAADLVNAIKCYITDNLLNNTLPPAPDQLDILAEGIVSLEYYLDAVTAGRSSTDSVLYMTRNCVKQLGYPVPKPSDEHSNIPVLEAMVTRIKNNTKLNIQTIIPDATPPPLPEPTHYKLRPNHHFATSTPRIETSGMAASGIEEIDEEVAEIFIEEASEELETIDQQIQILKISLNDTSALNVIRRAFHTLKGSGQIAGATDISEFAKGVEAFINNIICGVIDFNDSSLVLMESIYNTLHQLIEHFKARTPAPIELMEIADQARHFHESMLFTSTPPLLDTLPPNIDTTELNPFSHDELIAQIETTLHHQPNRTPAEPNDSSLPGSPHSSPPQTISHDRAATAIPQPPNDITTTTPIASILHEPINEIPTVVTTDNNQVQDSHHTNPYALNDDVLDVFINTSLGDIEKIELFVQYHLAASTEPPASIPTEIAQSINDLHAKALASEIEDYFQTTELLHQYVMNILDKKMSIQLETFEILDEFCITTREMLQNIRDTGNPELDPLFDNLVEPGDPINSGNIDSDTFDRATVSTDELALIDVFLEEAEELLENCATLVEQWQRQTPDDPSRFVPLQRLLHTIKGSARMAGITPVGNLSHTLESLFEALVDEMIDANAQVLELTEQAFDVLAEMIEKIKNDQVIHGNETLILKLKALLNKPTPIPYLDNTVNTATPSPIPPNTLSENNQLENNRPIAKNPENNATDTPIEITPPLNSTDLERNDNDLTLQSLPKAKATLLTFPDTHTREFKSKTETAYPDLPLPNDALPKPLTTDTKKSDTVRIAAEVLDGLVSYATESTSLQNRLEDQINLNKTHLQELDKTVTRLKTQLKDMSFDAQLSPPQSLLTEVSEDLTNNDAELDRFSQQQEIGWQLMESVGDIANLHSLLAQQNLDIDSTLLQLMKTHTAMQESLLRTRLISFSNQTQRLQRIVRQTSKELDKKTELHLEGAEDSIDRALLEKLMGPLEHLIRNAIAHGIESPHQRLNANKPETGQVKIEFRKERAEHILTVSDDGTGIDPKKIGAKALENGLMSADDELTEAEALQLILEPGFSTASTISQIAGRGIGMDVVNSEIQKLGGTLSINTKVGQGTTFTIRLPFTMALNQTLFIRARDDIYALPSANVEHTHPLSLSELQSLYTMKPPTFHWNHYHYPIIYLDNLLSDANHDIPIRSTAALVLIQFKGKLAAVHVDELIETRETVLKPTGPQLTDIKGISGATILENGKVALIIDVAAILALIPLHQQKHTPLLENLQHKTAALRVLVVDDSITVRRVTERFLSRYGIHVHTAKDGVDAIEIIDEANPDAILLDVEMPRMNGFDFTKKIRKDPRWETIPIIMITSRTGKKHQKLANRLGVDMFIAKPYQEAELLSNIAELTHHPIELEP